MNYTRVDWRAVMAGLKRAGITQPEIALALGCGQATLSDMARGKTQDPRFMLAAGLLRMAEQHGVDIESCVVQPEAA